MLEFHALKRDKEMSLKCKSSSNNRPYYEAFIRKKLNFYYATKVKEEEEEINKSNQCFDLNSRYFLSFLEESNLLLKEEKKNSNLLKKMKLQNFFVLFGNPHNYKY